MVAKISSNNSLFSTLLYNKKKLDEKDADSGIASLLSFEQHCTDYEVDNFAREKENKEKIRQKKRRGFRR